MDVRRVVQVWATGGDGSDLVGSGYLLSESVVLTATHALGAATDGILVQSHSGDGWTSRVQRVIDLGGDVSVLQCAQTYPGPLGVPPNIGGFGTRARQLDAVVDGFPDYQLQHPARTADSVPSP